MKKKLTFLLAFALISCASIDSKVARLSTSELELRRQQIQYRWAATLSSASATICSKKKRQSSGSCFGAAKRGSDDFPILQSAGSAPNLSFRSVEYALTRLLPLCWQSTIPGHATAIRQPPCLQVRRSLSSLGGIAS